MGMIKIVVIGVAALLAFSVLFNLGPVKGVEGNAVLGIGAFFKNLFGFSEDESECPFDKVRSGWPQGDQGFGSAHKKADAIKAALDECEGIKNAATSTDPKSYFPDEERKNREICEDKTLSYDCKLYVRPRVVNPDPINCKVNFCDEKTPSGTYRHNLKEGTKKKINNEVSNQDNNFRWSCWAEPEIFAYQDFECIPNK